MQEAASLKNLRTAERFLLAPPLSASFGAAAVALCDISARGARFRHRTPLEAGAKAILNVSADASLPPVGLEAVVVWTQTEADPTGQFVSGVRTYAAPEAVQMLLVHLKTLNRTIRIEELRSTDRFQLTPPIEAIYDRQLVMIDDLCARGARVELATEPPRGAAGLLQFTVPGSEIDVAVFATVAWSSVKTMAGSANRTFRAGLFIDEKPELMRLAIGHLCENGGASLDTESLRLKLKIMRARARQLAHTVRDAELSGVPAEQYLLIQGVREELRLNPEEAMHWYRRARMIINDPATRAVAPPIASHPDALAVWEYLDRSVDPSIVSRAFELS